MKLIKFLPMLVVSLVFFTACDEQCKERAKDAASRNMCGTCSVPLLGSATNQRAYCEAEGGVWTPCDPDERRRVAESTYNSCVESKKKRIEFNDQQTSRGGGSVSITEDNSSEDFFDFLFSLSDEQLEIIESLSDDAEEELIQSFELKR